MNRTTKTINGKKITITSAGYLYVNGVKQSEKIVTPFQLPTKNEDEIDVCRIFVAKNYKMVNG